MSSQAMSPSPRPLGFSSSKNAIFTDWCTKPPSRRTHLRRSGGWGTRREGRRKADAAADASGRTWMSELAISFIGFVSRFSSGDNFFNTVPLGLLGVGQELGPKPIKDSFNSLKYNPTRISKIYGPIPCKLYTSTVVQYFGVKFKIDF